MRVLVTGATGFVGGRIAERLLARGDEVHALVRTPSAGLERRGVVQHPVTLDDAPTVHRLLAHLGADAVVHAAASLDDDLDTARRANRDGTAALVDAARTTGVDGLVHLSTTSVYDRDALGEAEIDERAPLVGSGSAYAVTKAEAEAEVARACAAGLCALVLRPPAVLGAGPTSVWGTHVPRRMRDGDLPARDPEATFAWVHIEDLVDAALVGIDAPVTETLNVVGGHTTVGAYLDRVAELVGAHAPVPDATTPTGWRGRLTTDRLARVLGLVPHRTFDEAMEEIVAAWRG